MLKKLESVINNSSYYNFIRFNPLTDLFIEVTKKKTQKAIRFYSSFLDTATDNKLVFDIGANKGNKVKAFLKMGFSVIAVEPERKSLSTLYYRFRKNKKVTVIEKGVSDKEGVLTINIAEGTSGLNTLSDKWVGSLETKDDNRWHKEHTFKDSYEVNVTTLADLFAIYGVPYYVKIDVEGFEVNVIRGMNKIPVFISFETNLPEFVEETIECIRLLQKLSANTVFNYAVADRLELDTWISAEEMINRVRNPAIRYMEIIGHSARPF